MLLDNRFRFGVCLNRRFPSRRRPKTRQLRYRPFLEALEAKVLPSTTSWTPIGPSGLAGAFQATGRVTVAAPDPLDANVMYIGGEHGGIWKTTDWLDASPTWTPLTDNQPSLEIHPHCLAVSHNTPGGLTTIYAAADGPNGGILLSVNGGSTWDISAVNPGTGYLFNLKFGAVVVDPTNSNTIYVAANGELNGSGHGGIWKSTNGGFSPWTNVSNPWVQGFASDLVIDPSSPSTLYAAFNSTANSTDDGIWKTTDGGNSWVQLNNGIPTGSTGFGFARLALSANSPQNLYASIFDSTGFLARYKTISGGDAWTKLEKLPPKPDGTADQEGCCDHTFLAVDPSNPQVVYANGDHDMFQSTDGGNSWTNISNKLLTDLGNAVDPQEGYFDQAGAFLQGDDGGIYRWAFQLGASTQPRFEYKQGNLGVEQFNNLALDPSNPNTAYGIAYDKPALLRYSGTPQWNVSFGSGPGFSAENGTLLVDPNIDPTTMTRRIYLYGAPQSSPNGPQPQFGFYVSTDGGMTFAHKESGLNTADTPPDNFTALAEDPINSARLLLGTTFVYETLDRGETWSVLPMTPVQTNGVTITHLAIAPSDSNTIYASTSDGHFYISQNDGTSWQEVDQQLPQTASNAVASIQVDPHNSQKLFVVTTGGLNEAVTDSKRVWMTTNVGNGWTSITGDLDPSLTVNTLAVDWRWDTPVLYVGAARDVFSSSDLGQTWFSSFQLGENLPRTIVNDLVLMPNLNILAAATYGRGAWEIEVDGPPATHFGVFQVPLATPVTAGSSFSMAVYALDSRGAVVVGYHGTVNFVSSDSTFSLPQYTFQPMDNGVHVFTVTLTSAGSQTITVADDANSSLSGTASVTVQPAALAHFIVGAPQLTTLSTTAGAPFSLTVAAADLYGNTVTSYTGTVHFTSRDSNVQVVLPVDSTLTNGMATFSDVTLVTAGNQWIAATDTLNSSILGSIALRVDPAGAFLLVGSLPSSLTAGVPGNLTVTAYDRYDNVATGYAGTVTFTSSDMNGLVNLPADSMLTNGVGTFSVKLVTAGNQSITATDTVNTSITAGSASTTVNPGAASIFALSGFPTSITAGVPGNLVVTAYDFYDNVATGYVGTVHFTSSDSRAVLPADGTLTSGVGTFSVTLKTAGDQSITATDTVNTSITTVTSTTVNPGPPAAISASSGNGQSAPFGTRFLQPLVSTVTDAFGNGVPGVSVTFTTPTSGAGAVVTSATAMTDTSGQVSASVTANGSSGSYPITATAGGVATAAVFHLTNLPATIGGRVFQDINISGVQDPGEPGVGGQTVFLDLHGSGTLAADDPTAITDANGNFQFTVDNAGTYSLKEVLLGGVLLDTPPSGSYSVSLPTGLNLTSQNFANVPTSIAVPLTLPLTTPFPKQGNANADYVEALYRSILNRDAEPGGLAFWTGLLNNGASRLQVVQAIRQSPEHFTQEVTDFYFTLLNRTPDAGGLQSWVQQLENGSLTEEQVAFDFLNSGEYLSKGDKYFVDHMYLSLLGRSFDAAGEAHWLDALGDDPSGNPTHPAGVTHQQVISGFLYSTESQTRLVEGYYQIFLRRLAEPAGLNSWLATLQGGASFLSVGQGFLSSGEFYNQAAAQG